jgi:microcin C transport system substrate-binding protein
VKDGQRMEFNVLYASDDATPKLVVLAEEMKKAGVKMNLELKDWSAMLKQMNSNKHQVSFSGFGSVVSGVPDFWSIWHGANANIENSNNLSNVNDTTLNELIDNFKKSTEKDQRVRLARDIEARINELSVLIPAYTAPFFRQAYWRWWRLPKVPATNLSEGAFSPFSPSSGGLFWYDKVLHEETKKALAQKKTFPPVTVVDRTYEPSSMKKPTAE